MQRREPTAVLFACTMNSVRSPIAAALLRHFHGHRLWVQSVGVHTGEPDMFAVTVMDEIGIDLTHHRPLSFDKLEEQNFDLVVSLSPEAHHHALEMTRTMDCAVEFWPTFDPTLVDGSRERRLDVYREVRDDLTAKILERFPVSVARD